MSLTAKSHCGDNNGGCPHLCLPDPHNSTGIHSRITFMCVCADGYISKNDGHECILAPAPSMYNSVLLFSFCFAWITVFYKLYFHHFFLVVLHLMVLITTLEQSYNSVACLVDTQLMKKKNGLLYLTRS